MQSNDLIAYVSNKNNTNHSYRVINQDTFKPLVSFLEDSETAWKKNSWYITKITFCKSSFISKQRDNISEAALWLELTFPSPRIEFQFSKTLMLGFNYSWILDFGRFSSVI